MAGQTFGLYAGLVFFTPLIGGWVADRWLGAKRTVVIGVSLMTAGHAAMVFDQSFLLALLLLILGSGALKGNIAAQVGQLYAAKGTRRTTAFAVFSLSINVGAIFGPLVCGLLAQVLGWHYGFGAAGLLMLVALGLGYDQMYNMGMVWIDQAVELDTPLGRLPVAWFVSIDSVAIVAATAGVIALWQRQAKRGCSSTESKKIAIGGALTTIGVALISRYSPAKIAARLMAAAYLVAFFGNVISGYIATFYETMSPTMFWALNAGLCFAGPAAFYVFGPMLMRGVAAEPNDSKPLGILDRETTFT